MGAYVVSNLVAIGTFGLPILQSQNQHIQSIDQDNGMCCMMCRRHKINHSNSASFGFYGIGRKTPLCSNGA